MGSEGTCPVGSYDANGAGLSDMVGRPSMTGTLPRYVFA